MELSEYINSLRKKSDYEVLSGDWNSTNPGYGVEPITIDEVALYCLEMQLSGKNVPLDRFTPERAAMAEERRLYYLAKAMKEVTGDLVDHSEHPYSLYEMSEGESIDLDYHEILVSRPHEITCVRDMLQRIKRDSKKIKATLIFLRKESKRRDRKSSNFPNPKQYMDVNYRDPLIKHLQCTNKAKAKIIANQTIALAKTLYL